MGSFFERSLYLNLATLTNVSMHTCLASRATTLRFAGGAQRRSGNLWNSAEGPHRKDRAFSGAHVALPLPAEET